MRVRTSSKLRLLVALLLFPASMSLIGFVLWETMEHDSPSYWIAYALTLLLCLLGGKKLGTWARKGRGGPDEECSHCGHPLRAHHSWADYACNMCECKVLTEESLQRVAEEGKRLDAELAAEEDAQQRLLILKRHLEDERKNHPHG